MCSHFVHERQWKELFWKQNSSFFVLKKTKRLVKCLLNQFYHLSRTGYQAIILWGLQRKCPTDVPQLKNFSSCVCPTTSKCHSNLHGKKSIYENNIIKIGAKTIMKDCTFLRLGKMYSDCWSRVWWRFEGWSLYCRGHWVPAWRAEHARGWDILLNACLLYG